MALEGTIKDFGLADILQLIGIQRKTGILTMENGDDTVTVKFLEGQVVAADTRQMKLEDLLGSVLVRTGRITEAQLQDAILQQKATLQRLGYILVKTRAITEQDLRDALRTQVSQVVYRLFRWREGNYHFAPAERVDYDTDHFTPVGAETILMEGARMLDEWPIIERRIKSPTAIFRMTPAGAAMDRPLPPAEEDDLDFDLDLSGSPKEEKKDKNSLTMDEYGILHMANGKATVQSMVDRSPLGEFDVYRILCDLLNRSLIEEVAVAADTTAVKAEQERRQFASAAAAVTVVLIAMVGLITVDRNPARPWRVAGVREDGDLLKYYASEGRLERVEKALQVFYLDLGIVPETLDPLVAGGYLTAPDLLDPWGRPYDFVTSASGYELGGRDAAGRSDEGLRLRRAFSSSRRLLLGSPQP